MKTYLFPEVAANSEVTEWVPADVARELFDVLVQLQLHLNQNMDTYGNSMMVDVAETALQKACEQ